MFAYFGWYLWTAASVNHVIKHQKRQLILLRNVYTEILIDIDNYFGDNPVLPQRHDFKFYVNYLRILFKTNKEDKDDHKEEIRERLKELIERCNYQIEELSNEITNPQLKYFGITISYFYIRLILKLVGYVAGSLILRVLVKYTWGSKAVVDKGH